MQSKIETLEPMRTKPKLENALPIRATDRSDSEDPKATKSNTDIEDAILVIPKTEKLEPKRAQARNDREEPICTMSNTEIEDPKRA
jgi:hypothetical protein